MKIAISIIFAASLFGQQPTPTAPPKLPDATIAQYWRTIAAHHANNAELQASLTAKQKQLQEAVTAIDKQIEDIRKQLSAACGQSAHLDESGAEPICLANPKPEAAK